MITPKSSPFFSTVVFFTGLSGSVFVFVGVTRSVLGFPFGIMEQIKALRHPHFPKHFFLLFTQNDAFTNWPLKPVKLKSKRIIHRMFTRKSTTKKPFLFSSQTHLS